MAAVPRGTHYAIDQNSPQWSHMRRGEHGIKLGASEVGAAAGLSNFTRPWQLWEKLMGFVPREEETPEPCKHGHLCEPLIAGMYRRYVVEKESMDLMVQEGGYSDAPDGLEKLYGSSADRLVRDVGTTGSVVRLAEFKAPWTRMPTSIRPEYEAQMQFQMYCYGVRECDFMAVKLDRNQPEKTPPSRVRVFLARVEYSQEYIDWLLPRLFLFSKSLIEKKKPSHDLYETIEKGFEPPPPLKIKETFVENGAFQICGEA